MNIKMLAAAVIGFAALMTTASIRAAEIKVLASNGVREALLELAPGFERATGNKLVITFGLAAALKRQIEGGEAFDLAILTSAGIDDLAKQGKVDAGSRTPIARSGVGIGIKKGAPRPDIRTPGALKRTLLAAKSITWAKEGASGIYFASLLERIGIADQIKPKAVVAASGAEVGKLVAGGKVELGVILVNELMAAPGVELLGPLPGELQNYTVFHAGVGVGSKDSSAAKALIKFLTTPAAGAVFKKKGQEVG
ncbi:MAG TPA: substrate-binding domain-containing protein [Burkholderiales bacterium]|nr:substrate-binding domain-containing protein [Burkholderiales bacterium]